MECHTGQGRWGRSFRVGLLLALAAGWSSAASAAAIQSLILPANDGTSATNGQVLEFDSRTGAFGGVLAPSQGKSQIQGLTFGPDGSLYGSYFDTTSNTDGRVLRIRPDGAVEVFVAPGSGGLYSPIGLTFGPDGNLYVANNLGNVLRYAGGTGAFMDVSASGLSVPQDVVFGPDGKLYVSNGFGDSISLFDGMTGASLGFFVAPGAFGLDAPVGMAFGRDEDLYVASFPTNRIFRFGGASGALVSTFDLPYQDGLDTLLDVAFGPDKNLYASMRLSAGSTSILQLDPDSGAVLGTFASLPAPFGFNTGMLFVDQACSTLKSVEGQASACFAPKQAPEPGTLAMLVLGLVALAVGRRFRRWPFGTRCRRHAASTTTLRCPAALWTSQCIPALAFDAIRLTPVCSHSESRLVTVFGTVTERPRPQTRNGSRSRQVRDRRSK